MPGFFESNESAMHETQTVLSGVSANMRRVSGEFCFNNAAVPQQYKAAHQREAHQCAQAKQRLLDAETEEQVNTAAMVMNVLCQD